MAPRSYNLNLPTNPFLQVVWFVVGGILLVGAVLMSAFVLAIALGLAIVFGVVIFVRVWWLKRKIARAAVRGGTAGRFSAQGNPAGGSAAGRSGAGGQARGKVLEVEYTVVEERDAESRDDHDSRNR